MSTPILTQHLQELFEKEVELEQTNCEADLSPEGDLFLEDQFIPDQESAIVMTPQELVKKYDGSRITGIRKPSYERQIDRKVCPTDLDASPMQPSGGGSSVVGYSDHYIVDGGKQGIILHALVTPVSIMENNPLLDMFTGCVLAGG